MSVPIELAVVVDDSRADMFLHCRVLSRSGLVGEVREFFSASDALAFFQTQEVPAATLVLLDINMPIMTGFEFLERYQSLPGSKRARASVIMLSSSNATEDRAQASRYDCVSDYLVKPLDTQEVERLARQHFGHEA